MSDPDHEEVERVLATIEGRAFADAADALAGLAEGVRAVSEAWGRAPAESTAGPRERLLAEWLRRLMLVADRAALYFDGPGYALTVGFPAGVTIAVATQPGAPERRRAIRRRGG